MHAHTSHTSNVPNVPMPRYGHSRIVVGRSMFVFGGVGSWSSQTSATLGQEHHSVRHDLWRLDADTHLWTEIQTTPYTSPRRANPSSIISPWGLLRTGGVAALPAAITDSPLRALHFEFRSYVSRLWHRLSTSANGRDEASGIAPYAPGPQWHRSARQVENATGVGSRTVGNSVPRQRSGHTVVLLGVPGKESHVRRSIESPRIVLFGGYDETKYLNDLWTLELNRLRLNKTEEVRDAHCEWRKSSNASWTPCLRDGAGTAVGTSDPSCSIDEVVMRSWCENYVQSFRGVHVSVSSSGVPS
jgi:hypothetical protein